MWLLHSLNTLKFLQTCIDTLLFIVMEHGHCTGRDDNVVIRANHASEQHAQYASVQSLVHWISIHFGQLGPVAAFTASNFFTNALPPTFDQPNNVIPLISRHYAYQIPHTHHHIAVVHVQHEWVFQTQELHIHDNPSAGNPWSWACQQQAPCRSLK